MITAQKLLCLLAFLYVLPAAAQQQEQMININGTAVYCKIIGKGEPLLIIHGGPGLNHHYLVPGLQALAAKYQLIFYDQRACGSSPCKDSSSMNLKQFARDIETIRTVLKLEKIHLLAHSWGVLPAMEYLKMFPGFCKSVILSNTIPLSHEFDEEQVKVLMARKNAKDSSDRATVLNSAAFKSGKPETYDELIRISFRNSFYNKQFVDSLSLQLQESFTNDRSMFFYMSRELSAYDYYNVLPGIDCPVLIIGGDYDAIPLQADQKALGLLKKGRLERMEHCGHFPFIECRKEYQEILLGFLKTIKH